MEQEIRFCTAPDGARIAYATMGDGPPLVKAANWLSHLEFDLRSPVWRHWLRELSATHRLIRYDERGCGLSDWDVEDFSLDAWVSDLETVVEAVGVDRFPLLGISQGGAVAITYAVRHPERVSHLILYGIYACGWKNRQMDPEVRAEFDALITLTRQGWGRASPAYRQVFTGLFVPDASEEQLHWFNELQRISTSPANAARFQEAFGDVDVVDLLSGVTVPTLVLHARGDARIPFDEGRHVAAKIPDSRFVSLESRNHILLERDPAWPVFLSEVRRFLGVESAEVIGHGVGAARAAEAGATAEAGVGPAAEDEDRPRSFIHRLRERRMVQWALAYAAAAWAALQGLDLVREPWGLGAPLVRGVQVLLAVGFPMVLVIGWYHGEKGRQRVSGAELLIIAGLLAIAGLLLTLLS